MKKWSLVPALIILIGMLVFAGCSQPTPAPSSSTPKVNPTTAAPTAAPAVTLSYSNFFPPTHFNSILAEQWCKEIEKRTNGAVKFTYVPAGALTPANKIYDGVVSGISSLGMSVLSYTPGRFPVSELIDMPHAYPSGYVATMVANDFYKQFQPAEFKDVHVLYFHAHGPGVLYSTNKPVRKLEDLKGMVLRSTGVGADIANALGASGYAASQGEAIDLMSKGVIQGSLAPWETVESWKQAEVVKYITDSYDIGYTADMFVVMNKAQWDSLTPAVQKVFTDTSSEWIEKHAKGWTYYDKSAVNYFKNFPGREVISLPADEMARWVTAVKPVVDKKLTELNSKNLPAADYEKYLKDRIQYWSGKAPSTDNINSWYQTELKPLLK